jgi:hypothetical protein
MTRDPVDVRAIRRHFAFPELGRIVTNNAASTQPPRELLALYVTAVAAIAADRVTPRYRWQSWQAGLHSARLPVRPSHAGFGEVIMS